MKPLIIIGHDECIFKQNRLSKKHWVSLCGTWVLVPKDEGRVWWSQLFNVESLALA